MFNPENQMCVICESDQMATLSLHLKTAAVFCHKATFLNLICRAPPLGNSVNGFFLYF